MALLHALQRKDKGFLYLETHAGRGAYDLGKSTEARTLALADAHAPELNAYAGVVASWRARTGNPRAYPGSPLIAASLLRPQDRAVLIELLATEAHALERALGTQARVHVECGDGFELLRAHLPPPERRALLLIDPPYEIREEYARVATAIQEALRRFQTGPIAAWYPIKDSRDTALWHAQLVRRIEREALVSEIWLHPCDSRVALNGSGLLIVNPPYQLAERMRAWLPELHALLDGARSGGASVRPLTAPAPAAQHAR
ncbi:MAG TPA: 23S rRNA (adenine(2030)-N(6))-methyltransferase RlmJ [Steroidobacteraceae bacterium]|nr:23S rRNA (adenine(2030)-N(6))-methyltransferase RlmJ [Steroidobacteraceae bacterium]